jgi:Flp pilus assembly pilin Flp
MLNALSYIHILFRQGLTKRLHLDDRGVTSVEYALLVVLIALVMGAGALILGNGLSGLFNNVGTTVGNQKVPNP